MLVCSAQMLRWVDLQVQKLQRAALKDPVKCAVSTKYSTVDKLQQYYVFIPSKYKVGSRLIWSWAGFLCFIFLSARFKLPVELQDCYLVSILNELAGNSFMIFCSTCNNAQRVALMLRNLGITAIPLHGQMSQVALAFSFKLSWKMIKYQTLKRNNRSILVRINVSARSTSSSPSRAPFSWQRMWRPEAWTSRTSTASSTTTSLRIQR